MQDSITSWLEQVSLRMKLKVQKQHCIARPFEITRLKDPVVPPNFSIKLQNRFRMLEEFVECAEVEKQWNIVKQTAKNSGQGTKLGI